MVSMSNLLVELRVEELPPKALRSLGEAFASGLTEGLRARGLLGDKAVARSFASPRRLALHLTQVRAQAAESTLRQKLMPVSVGLGADGMPTPALLKKLRALGGDDSLLPSLERVLDGKSETLFWPRQVSGMALSDGLQQALLETLARLPIPKLMRYQLNDGWSNVQFVRPAHGLVALHGAMVVPVSVMGLQSGRSTQGHRFEALHSPLSIHEADSYELQLRTEGAVIAHFDTRRDDIYRQLAEAALRAQTPGARPVDDEALLDEVTALVERPHVLLCEFEPEFLSVPPECLILTMKANQKYFPLLDAQGRLTHQFLVVSNISPKDPSRIIEGNERVVRPRLADAKFFFDQDRKKTLADRVPGLDKVVYHAQLGSQGARVKRVRLIARWVAQRIGADVILAERAALLAKADLLTEMVGEFPELQGVMGGYYARHDGEADTVAVAIETQYLNRRGTFSEASDLVAQSLLIADRTETLVGIWGIGLKPTGEKDPFALRRHALTLIHSFEAAGARQTEGCWGLKLRELLQITASVFTANTLAPETVEQVESFIYERYLHQLSNQHDPRSVIAVMALRPPLDQALPRLNAIQTFLQWPEAPALAAANKRVGHILKKSATKAPSLIDPAVLQEPAEQSLYEALQKVQPLALLAFESGDYTASLKVLAALRSPVDAFFDTVMVNADDLSLRNNRLALLSQLQMAMNGVADLSQLAV